VKTIWLMTANPVRGRMENQSPLAIFTEREKAIAYYEASKLPEVEVVDGFYLTFREDSLLRWYNGRTIGDWHPPAVTYGYLVADPCIYDVQLWTQQVHDSMTITGPYPVDPDLPSSPPPTSIDGSPESTESAAESKS
jgi:hypothetical protein